MIRWIAEAFSESGTPSSKRICGGLVIMAVVFCTIWCVIRYGMTDQIKNLLETEIISACALLGISSVTSIWKQDAPPPQINEDCD